MWDQQTLVTVVFKKKKLYKGTVAMWLIKIGCKSTRRFDVYIYLFIEQIDQATKTKCEVQFYFFKNYV